MTEHTRLCWKVRNGSYIYDETNRIVAAIAYPNAEKKAIRIVKAVNNHARLVKSLRWTYSILKQLQDAGMFHEYPNSPWADENMNKAQSILREVGDEGTAD